MEVEEDIDMDGVNSLDTDMNQTPDQLQESNCHQKLQAGFGFTQNTSQFRSDDGEENGACSETSIETIEQNDADQSNNGTDESIKCVQIEEALDIEMDTIITKDVQEKVLQTRPRSIAEDFVDMSPKHLPTEPTTFILCMIPFGRKKPEKKTVIVIPHDNEEDEFGASLITFKDVLKDGSLYYRHFLAKIDSGGPADQMKIDNNDEIVLLNEDFVPELTHDEVLGLFRDVKVDGNTRFILVLRRVRNKKWEWIETSAVLAPERHTDDHPVVERVEFKKLRGENIEVPKSQHIYKVPGTQQYLDICDGNVSIDTLKNDDSDRTKIIWKRAKYWQDESDQEHINFAAALCDEEMRWYIGIDRDNIVLKPEPVWFKMIKIGSKIRFKFDGKYLGYDLTDGEVKPEVSQCVFAELPASAINTEDSSSHSEVDIPENIESMSAEPSERSYRSSISSSLRSINVDNRSIASSQTSVDSDKSSILSSQSSILSSQVSTDSGGMFAEYSGSDSCGEHFSLQLSQASITSGYMSDNSIEKSTRLYKPTNLLLNESGEKQKDLTTASQII